MTTTEATTTLQPLADRILVKAMDADTVSAGGVVLPEAAQEKPQRGVVVAVGPGKWEHGHHHPPSLEAGDHVLYTKYGGTEIEVEGQDLLVLKETDVLARIEEATR